MRTVLLGGLAVAAAAAAMKNRDKVAGLIGARSSAPEPAPPGPAPAPAPSNYDVSGPAANTATPVPAPEPLVRGEGAVDERAEEEAAAAEAAAIGGETAPYAGGEPGEQAGEAERPLMEAGEGESEGQEQAEAMLADSAEGDAVEAERRIDEVIEEAGRPASGETVEPLVTDARASAPQQRLIEDEPAAAEAEEPAAAEAEEPAADTDAGAEDQPTVEIQAASGEDGDDDEPAAPEEDAGRERPASEKSVWAPPERGGKDDDSEWQTWSGRAIRP